MPLSFQNRSILVVGGAGFVGSNLVRRILKDSPADILIVDNLLSADMVNVPVDPRITFVARSITEDQVLRDLPDLDFVFHLATYHGNQSSMIDPLADHENNTLTTLKLLERIKSLKLEAFVYSSAGCTVAQKTFDAADATTEEDPVSLYLDSPYQISKIIGEFYGNYYYRQHGVPFIKARFQNVYGPGEILGAGRWRGSSATVWRNVTPTFIWKALHGEPLPVENGGAATRDFIYVEDIVEGLVACALRGRAGETYNLASGEETSILQLAKMINSICGNASSIDLKPARTWDRSGKRFGDPTKAKQFLDYEATMSLEEGLRRTVEWTQINRNDIARCVLQHKTHIKELNYDV